MVDADTIEIYQAYQRKTYVGDNPAVLAIDLYNKAYQGGNRPVSEVDREFSGSCGENAWKALPPTQKLFAAARRAGVPVIYTTRHVDTGGVHSTNRNMRQPARRHLRHQGGTGAAAGRTRDLQGARLGLLRHAADRAPAEAADQFTDHLRREHVGLRARLDGRRLSYGFHNVVVEECTYDRSMLSHKVNLFDLHHKYADVMHVEEVLAHLDGLAVERKVA